MQGSQYLNPETHVVEACCKGMYVRLATPALQPHFKDAIIHLSSQGSSGWHFEDAWKHASGRVFLGNCILGSHGGAWRHMQVAGSKPELLTSAWIWESSLHSLEWELARRRAIFLLYRLPALSSLPTLSPLPAIVCFRTDALDNLCVYAENKCFMGLLCICSSLKANKTFANIKIYFQSVCSSLSVFHIYVLATI